MKKLKILNIVLLVMCMLFVGNPLVSPINAATTEIKIILKDEITGDFISGVAFDFYEMDMVTNSLIIPAVGTATTDGNGEASVIVSAIGRYVAVYDNGLNAAVYDVPSVSSQQYAIDVTQSNEPGVQLIEQWSGDWSKFVFRDVIYDNGYLVVSGNYIGSTGVVIPAEAMESGVAHTMGANDTGVILKINATTGKCVWIRQFNSYVTYSVIKSGGYYYATGYSEGYVNKVDATNGALVATVPVTVGGNRQFDIYPTSDGGFVVAGTGHIISKVDSTDTEIWSTNIGAVILAETTSAMPHFSIKSLTTTSNPNEFIISGGMEANNDRGAYIARIDVTNPATPVVVWFQELAPGIAKARFNSVVEVVEGADTYLVASGNLPGNGVTYTIPSIDTVSGTAISLDTSSTAASTALIAKLDATTGKFVWANTFGGVDTNNVNVEQEFNSVIIAEDSVGGYVVSGQVAGTVNVPATDNTLGVNINVITNDTNYSDSIIARYTTDGKYVDSYLFGTAGRHDEYYGGVATSNWFYSVGNDAVTNLVALSINLTSSPRTIMAPHLPQFTVRHYQMDLDGVNYTLKDTSTYSGNAGTTASFTNTTYVGFTYNSALTTFENSTNVASTTALPITANGSLVIKLYYTRDSYTITYDGNAHTDGILPTDSNTYLFGETVTISTDAITKDGLIFAGWKASSIHQPGTTMVINEAVANTADAGNVITLTAQWKSQTPATGVSDNISYMLFVIAGASLVAMCAKRTKQD